MMQLMSSRWERDAPKYTYYQVGKLGTLIVGAIRYLMIGQVLLGGRGDSQAAEQLNPDRYSRYMTYLGSL